MTHDETPNAAASSSRSSPSTTGRDTLCRRPEDGARNSAAKARLALLALGERSGEERFRAGRRQRFRKGAAEVKALGLPAGEFPEREGGMQVIVPGDHAIDQRRLAKVHGRRHAGEQRGLLADRFRDACHGWQRRGAQVQVAPQLLRQPVACGPRSGRPRRFGKERFPIDGAKTFPMQAIALGKAKRAGNGRTFPHQILRTEDGGRLFERRTAQLVGKLHYE